MDAFGPCSNQSSAVHVFIVSVNAIQTVLIAWLANRARSKDSKERRENGNGNKSQ